MPLPKDFMVMADTAARGEGVCDWRPTQWPALPYSIKITKPENTPPIAYTVAWT